MNISGLTRPQLEEHLELLRMQMKRLQKEILEAEVRLAWIDTSGNGGKSEQEVPATP